MQRIAIWNTAFLGDALLTLPLIQALHKKYPAAVLDFYVRKGFSSLFITHPAIGNVYEYDKRGAQKGLLSGGSVAGEVRSRRYDAFIGAHTSLRSSLLALASGAPIRIGYQEAVLSRLCYTHRVPRSFGSGHEVDRLFRLLRPLGIQGEAPWPELVLPEQSLHKAQAFFSDISIPTLGIHPGSVWETKRWPSEYFAQVAWQALQAGVGVMLFAGPGEESVAAEVRTALSKQEGWQSYKDHFFDLSGKLSLPELASFIKQLSAYVSNDSGPMHMAWIQKTPVVAIFGPTVESFGFFPRGFETQVVEVSLACRPCGLHGGHKCPKGHHNCMRQVRADTVWQKVSTYILR